MLKVILQYTNCLQDGKNVFRILADFNIQILETKEETCTKSQVTILVKDNDTLNLLISTLNRCCSYEVSVVKIINSKCVYDTPSMSSNTIQIGIGLPKIKSHLKVGNLTIHNTHHFNWFHRMMWKLFFGFEIENIKEKNNEEH